MSIKLILLLFVISCMLLVEFGYAIHWLGVQRARIRWNNTIRGTREPALNNLQNVSLWLTLQKLHGFSKVQVKICRKAPDTIQFIIKAAQDTNAVCKFIFSSRRWNCSSMDSAPFLTPDLTRGTREQAFVYAISSASLSQVLAKACASAALKRCFCGSHPKGRPNENFKWGGCGDNVKWATRFSRRFLDSTENHVIKDSPAFIKPFLQNEGDSRQQRALVNLHNNRVGRRIVSENLKIQCKCHGVSGSCSVKTCWKALPPTIEIGQKLLRRYVDAVEVSKNFTYTKKSPEAPSHKMRSLDQLVYFSKSPDYCTKNKMLGSFGTKGRKCNATSSGTDSCTKLCCGRGFRSIIEERLERCFCKYYYCCYVQCKTCRNFVEVHECK